MTTDPEGAGRSPHQSRRDMKKDRFRQRLKQGVNSELNDNFVTPDPRDELELVSLPTTDASQKIETPVAGRPAMSLDRMRSARRAQDLGQKREKLIQKLRNDKNKRQQLLPSFKAEDDSDHGYLVSGVNGNDSMLSSDGFSALEASTMSGGDSLGAFTMSDDVHDVTNHSNDTIGDALIDRQVTGLGSEVEQNAQKFVQNTTVQRSELRQARQETLTRVDARGRIQKSRRHRSFRSLGALSFETLDDSRHTLSDSQHDYEGEVVVYDSPQVEFSTLEQPYVIQGTSNGGMLKCGAIMPAGRDSSTHVANVSFDTLDESRRSFDGSWNEVAGHHDPEMNENPSQKMRSRLVAQGMSRVRMRRSKDNPLASRDASNLNACISSDAPDDSRHNEREDPKSDLQKAEKPFKKMRRRLVGIGLSRARIHKSMDSQLIASKQSEQIVSASFDSLNNSHLSLDDSRHDELTKKKSPEPPRPETSVRTRLSRSLSNRDCEADTAAPISSRFDASDMKLLDNVTASQFEPDEAGRLRFSNVTSDASLRAVSLESLDHDPEMLVEGGGLKATAFDECQPGSHPSIGDGTRVEVPMTDLDISELDAPADEKEGYTGNLSNEKLLDPVQLDALLQGHRPTLGDTSTPFEHDAPADEKEMYTQKLYSTAFRNSAHLEAPANENCAIADSQHSKQTIDFISHRAGTSSVEVGIDCPLDEVRYVEIQDFVTAKQPSAVLENQRTNNAAKAAPGGRDDDDCVHGVGGGVIDAASMPGKDSIQTDHIEGQDGADIEAESEVSADCHVKKEHGLLLVGPSSPVKGSGSSSVQESKDINVRTEENLRGAILSYSNYSIGEPSVQGATTQERQNRDRRLTIQTCDHESQEVESSGLASQRDVQRVCRDFQEVGTPPPPPPSKNRRSSKNEVNIVFDFSEDTAKAVREPSNETCPPNVGTPPPPPPPKKKKKRRTSRVKEPSTSIDATAAPASTTDIPAEAGVLCPGEPQPTKPRFLPEVKLNNKLEVDPGSHFLTVDDSLEPASLVADLNEPQVVGIVSRSPLSAKYVVARPFVSAAEAPPPPTRMVLAELNHATDVVEGGVGPPLTMKDVVRPILQAGNPPIPTQRVPPPETSLSVAVNSMMPMDGVDTVESFPMSPGLLLDSVMFFKNSRDEPQVEISSAPGAASSTNAEVAEIFRAPSTPRSEEKQSLFCDSALSLRSSSECSELMGASKVAWTKPPGQFEGAGDDSGDSLDEVEHLSVGAVDLGLIGVDANTCEGTRQLCTTDGDFQTNNPPSEKEIKSVLRQALVDEKLMFANDANGRFDEVIVMPVTEVMASAIGKGDADSSDNVKASGISTSNKASKPVLVTFGVANATAPTDTAAELSAHGWDVRSIVAHPPETLSAAFDCDAAAWDASRVIFDPSAIDPADVSTLEALDSKGPTPDDFTSANMSDCAEAHVDLARDAAKTCDQIAFEKGWADTFKSEDVDAQENEAVAEDIVALLKDQGAGNAHFPGADEGRLTKSQRIEAYNSMVCDSSSCDESGDADSDEDDDDEVVQYVPHDADAEIGIDNLSERQDIIAARFSGAGVATFDAAAAIAEAADSFVVGPSAIEKQINGDLLALADSPLRQIAKFNVNEERPNVNKTEKGSSPKKLIDVEDAVSTSRDTAEFPVHYPLIEGKVQVSQSERVDTCGAPAYDCGAFDDNSRTDNSDPQSDGIQCIPRNANAAIENVGLSERNAYAAVSSGTGVASFRRAETLTEQGENLPGSANVVQDFALRSSAIEIKTPLNSVAPAVGKRQIPLLSPPPEEKFKKWEEGKLAPLKCLEAIQNNARIVNLPLDSPEKTSLFDGQPSEAHGEKANHTDSSLATKVASQSESVIIDQSMNVIAELRVGKPYLPLMTRLQMKNLRDDRSFDDAGVELLSKTSSFDKSLRPGDGKIVIGEKMAEKVAIASSVAAERLEECLVAKSSIAKSITVESGTFDAALRKTCKSAVDPLNEQCYLSQSSDVVARGKDGDALLGGAFSGWKDAAIHCTDNSSPTSAGMMVSGEAVNVDRKSTSLGSKASQQMTRYENQYVCRPKEQNMSEDDLAVWLRSLLLQSDACEKTCDPPLDLRSLLDDDDNFEYLCALVAAKVSQGLKSKELEYRLESPVSGTMKELIPFSLASGTQRPAVMAANFVSFVQRIGKLTGIASPFKKENPFVLMVVGESMVGKKEGRPAGSVQQLVFEHGGADAVQITGFFYEAVRSSTAMAFEGRTPTRASASEAQSVVQIDLVRYGRRYEKPPETNPSPFENASWTLPSVVLVVIGFLGDPVAVCRMKMVNRFCKRIISENEHTVMRDAVRAGGMSMNVRPAFWLWVTLEKCGSDKMDVPKHSNLDNFKPSCAYPVPSKIAKLAQLGREGPWHGVIKRDVTRAFGNMPPHKTGAKLRADSIVRALVTFGQGRLIKRGVKGGGFSHPTPSISTPGMQKSKSKLRASTAPPPWEVGDDDSEASDGSMTPTDTVSDWGGVSPVASFASSIGDDENRRPPARRGTSALESQGNSADQHSIDASREATDDLVLNGNTLTPEMKIKLQNQLQFILHALAAEHEDVGYCQGMDYIVAHLLRVLQDTVMWRAAKGSLPVQLDNVAKALPNQSGVISDEAINESLIVEEAVFRVMDCLFTTYNLRHMFWPELRSLKICCRVFERLVLHKLPVLADHFEHHELNVGLFALGWFQTLFLYLPSMPTATVCHIWDIWLVERSYKIFFRVGTAILFLSQPILLNHDLEGMMTYLNTFPDATLLKPDILIACALQIKVTNQMLTDLEIEVTGGH